uniref:SAM domain-containing protein n=1 Tax=Vitis vinifera TaxID=29760 RepID=A5AVU2_VITVI|nr:hypothetical protein VITISV_011025 [Vitis vinifera]
MYADRVEAGAKRSVYERLNGTSLDDSGRRRQFTGKRKRPLQLMDEKEEWVDINTNGEDNRAIRQRQDDDKWEHDLYEDGETQISNIAVFILHETRSPLYVFNVLMACEDRKVGARDLRLKLQKKVGQQVPLSGKGSLSGGVRDLREKLSGTMHSQPVNNDPPKAKPAMEAGKPTRKNVAVEAPVSGTKKVASQADTSVDGFLQSLGLEKYLITFQAEEVDMTALIHMTDEDLKAMGIPMLYCWKRLQ